jgi:nitric oxide reductase subunit B
VDRLGAVTERPGGKITYTNNWPHEPLVGNKPPPSTFLWSAFSVTFLLAGIALLGWYYAVSHGRREEPHQLPEFDPMRHIRATPSMLAVGKYFWTLLALFLVQILLGIITAHYQVEGQDFYGLPLSEVLPYSITRTWHTQLAVLWIAVAWLATGLYIAPAVSGYEPPYQRLGVNFLWVSLLIIVVGFVHRPVAGREPDARAGAQLLVRPPGLGICRHGTLLADHAVRRPAALAGAGRAARCGRRCAATVREPRSDHDLLFLSTVAIGLFYATGLMWGKHTHLSMVTYWRWWLVHLWVEGFFEVFATAVIALLVHPHGADPCPARERRGAVHDRHLPGRRHPGHAAPPLLFAGTPTSVIAIGAMFSALEVVPLALIGFEAYENYRHSKATPWVARYRWAGPVLSSRWRSGTWSARACSASSSTRRSPCISSRD